MKINRSNDGHISNHCKHNIVSFLLRHVETGLGKTQLVDSCILDTGDLLFLVMLDRAQHRQQSV